MQFDDSLADNYHIVEFGDCIPASVLPEGRLLDITSFYQEGFDPEDMVRRGFEWVIREAGTFSARRGQDPHTILFECTLRRPYRKRFLEWRTDAIVSVEKAQGFLTLPK